MASSRDPLAHHLPLIPKAILRRHKVLEGHDTRFRSCARLMQSLWRERHDLPMGSFVGRSGRSRRLGSLLSANAAAAGRNFMSPAVARLADRVLIYRERSAFIEQNRLYGNLLSSAPLCLNLFAPLHFDHDLAARVMRSLLPNSDIAKILDVRFEHSPGRNRSDLTDDRSAFDVALFYERSDGEKGFIGVEQKFSESGRETQGEYTPRMAELAATSELYRHPNNAFLQVAPLQQLSREHLLTFASLHRGDYAEAFFVLVAPRHNHLIQRAAELYAAQLLEPGPGHVPFVNLELEKVIETLAWAGEPDYAGALFDRYCDWTKLDDLIEEALSSKSTDWAVHRPRQATLSILPRAA